MTYKRLSVLIFSLLSLYQIHAADWDGEYWQYLNWKNGEWGPYKLYTLGECRLNRHLSKFCYYKISECFAYKVLPYVTLEAHYSYISNKSRGATHFNSKQRLELEINPGMTLDNDLTLLWRNRIEAIKKEGKKDIQFVFRHRLMMIYPLEECGKLVAVKWGDEVYYDFDTTKFTQNRLIPLELTFALSPHTTLDLFFMIRNFFSFSSHKWYRSFVVGSEVGF